MLSQRMEIKVAILGNVSAGKTTVLNALLRNKYGEVAKKRTTAGASYFYLNVQQNIKLDVEELSIESIYQEIKEENEKKVSNGHEIYTKDFEIQISEPLVCCRQDTVIVVVDIPGINEAGNDNKYKDFVSNHWKTFDCVIVVMDGKVGVNTEDQVSLLNFVKTNYMTIKQIPIIILCNKIDNPDDEEQEELVKEARKEIEKIFHVSCREISLKQTLQQMTISTDHNTTNDDEIKFQQSMSPAFIPISAGNAYIYRCGSQSTIQNFHKLDIDVIDGFGRNQFGQKVWKTLSREDKLDKVYSMVNDPEQYNDGLNDCNFDALLKVLEVFIGGKSRQTSLLQQQVQMALHEVTQGPFETGKITETIRAAYKNLTGLGALEVFGGISNLQNKFWLAYSRYESICFQQFTNAWPKQNLSILAGPMEELNLYFQFVNEMNSSCENEKCKILEKGEQLVCRYFKYLLQQNALLEIANKLSDGIITSYEWFLIIESILLLSYNEQFCHIFGRTKIEFSYRLLKANIIISEESKVTEIDNRMKHHSILQQNYKELILEDGIFPIHPKEYNNLVRIHVPCSLSDSNHFGHLPFIYCKLAEQIGIDRNTTRPLKWKLDIVNEQQEQSMNFIFPPKPKQKFTSRKLPKHSKKASKQTTLPTGSFFPSLSNSNRTPFSFQETQPTVQLDVKQAKNSGTQVSNQTIRDFSGSVKAGPETKLALFGLIPESKSNDVSPLSYPQLSSNAPTPFSHRVQLISTTAKEAYPPLSNASRKTFSLLGSQAKVQLDVKEVNDSGYPPFSATAPSLFSSQTAGGWSGSVKPGSQTERPLFGLKAESNTNGASALSYPPFSSNAPTLFSSQVQLNSTPIKEAHPPLSSATSISFSFQGPKAKVQLDTANAKDSEYPPFSPTAPTPFSRQGTGFLSSSVKPSCRKHSLPY